MYYQLTDQFVAASDLDATWKFFSDAKNLPAITPPWLNFRIDTPEPIQIGKDSVLDYTIRWMGLPVRWRTLIIDWQPPVRFVDLQIKGPYVLWHHQHTFEPIDGGVKCGDRVIYRLPGGFLAPVAHAIIVRNQLLEIFRFRRGVISNRLGWVREIQTDVDIARLG